MKSHHPLLSNIFIIAGLMNASVLIFSKGFTNQALSNADPAVMSNFGLIMILLWGAAYITVAKTYQKTKWLVGVFAVEKLAYVWVYLSWHHHNSWYDLFETDALAGLFYLIYGINDAVFCLFFIWIFIKLQRRPA